MPGAPSPQFIFGSESAKRTLSERLGLTTAARLGEAGKFQKCLAINRTTTTAPETEAVATILTKLCAAIASDEDQ